MYQLHINQLEKTSLDNNERYVYEIRAEVAGLAYPQVCEREMAVSIAGSQATKIPSNVAGYVVDNGSSFPDLKTAIAAIKEQLNISGYDDGEFSFMLGDDAVRFLLGLHTINGYEQEVFNAAEIHAASQYLQDSKVEDVVLELETSGRDVVEILGKGDQISVNWSHARHYFGIKDLL